MRAYSPTNKKWEWAHKRNRTLLQGNIFAQGLSGKAYYPAVRFRRENYLSVNLESEGEYFFYDKPELTMNTLAFHEDIDSGRFTPKKLRALSEKFFNEAVLASEELKNAGYGKLANKGLLKKFVRFRKAMTVGPIITVQLWGIESCLHPEYRLIKFLERRALENGKQGKTYEWVETLTATREKTVPFSEHEEFLAICAEIEKDKALARMLRPPLAPAEAEKILLKHKEISRKLEGHAKKYAWMHAEYKSEPWTMARWVEAIQKELENDCAKALEALQEGHEELLGRRRKLILELDPPAEVMRVIEALEEFMWQRDWSKGRYSEIFLNWKPFEKELAKRMGCKPEEASLHTLDEIQEFLAGGTPAPKFELERRAKRCVCISVGTGYNVYTNGVDGILEKEGVAAQFTKNSQAQVQGVTASRGKITGVARVVLKAQEKELVQKGEILVTYMTTVEFTPVFKKIAGLITDEGGMSSHAAIVSREFGLPCIIGTKNATRVFRTGDRIELDADNGTARKIPGKTENR